ncbi:MAG: DUF115 domain-containing protein [Candidatus Thermoplasmatota archaeon]|nr:DUF115 domain-containing protein [Euryarchaeota archaeon]MBU4031293.1 DUF115 domain-containing protein [Candidatus Thermoplasmatota archaeon]MBU4072208.1 DUF115 domain-containing protein [Candidatus Thermoplasmatota archaeon]MBU4145152.1 DUF115 domain-containing protein [Candidatus Thermoplasmatota archaeon]MBU4592699.1 DUF115 domain-containing protein [Candidatus Thermoplasmatota archaeon]
MNWKEWKPWYEGIVAELGIDPETDMASAKLLAGLLPNSPEALKSLESILRGKTAVILGPAPFQMSGLPGGVIIVAGSAMDELARLEIQPEIIVTDLDGDVALQVEASLRGAVSVIHAHGDNMDAIRRWVPEFRQPIIGTTQVEPLEGIYNFGGFTDGDRAVFMSMHFGASRIILKGFDFDNPTGKPFFDIARKKKKLGIARRLIEHASANYDIDVE